MRRELRTTLYEQTTRHVTGPVVVVEFDIDAGTKGTGMAGSPDSAIPPESVQFEIVHVWLDRAARSDDLLPALSEECQERLMDQIDAWALQAGML